MALGGNSKTQKSTSPMQEVYGGGSRSTFMFKLLNWSIWGIVGAIVLTNIKPYERLASMLLSRVDYSDIGQFIAMIPLIGGIFAFVFKFLNFGVGTLFWLFVQILELIPTELLGHEGFLDKNIQQANRNNYRLEGRDSWEVKIAKRMRNSISTEVLRFLILLGGVTYVADFFLCLTIFPPVINGGNVWKLLDVISLQRWGMIDWGNILQAIATVGAVQFLLKLRKIIVKIIADIT